MEILLWKHFLVAVCLPSEVNEKSSEFRWEKFELISDSNVVGVNWKNRWIFELNEVLELNSFIVFPSATNEDTWEDT
jgi:hypothetical protein